VGGEYLNNLQPRQQHLQQVLSTLKQLAENNNAVAIYTNHVRNEIGSYGRDKGPQGGHVMAHASDIRIALSRAPNGDSKKWYKYNKHDPIGLRAGRAQIVDCGFLPNEKGYYLIGPMGIADPRKIKEITKQAEIIQKDGYLSVNALGQHLDPMYEDAPSRQDRIDEIMMQLYGTEDEEESKSSDKKKSKKSSSKESK